MSTTLGQLRVRLLKHPLGAGCDAVLLAGFINDRAQKIMRAYDWTRLIKEGTLQTVAVYETGTVTILNGATSGTGSGTTFTSGMTGRKIRFEGRNESYTFTYVGAGSFTIDRAYEGDDLTDGTFKIYQNVYSLGSDVNYVESLKCPRTGRDLDPVGREWLDERDAARLFYGDPVAFTTYEDSSDSTPLTRIELYRIPTIAEGLPYRYKLKVSKITIATAASTKFPEWMSEEALFQGVLSDLADLTGQDASRYEAKYRDAVQDMIRDDVNATETQVIEMHPRYTGHRSMRVNDDVDPDFIEFWQQRGE